MILFFPRLKFFGSDDQVTFWEYVQYSIDKHKMARDKASVEGCTKYSNSIKNHILLLLICHKGADYTLMTRCYRL